MATSDEPGDDDGTQAPRGQDAWKQQQRRIRERNDEARRAGKAERLAAEQRVVASERASRERGVDR